MCPNTASALMSTTQAVRTLDWTLMSALSWSWSRALAYFYLIDTHVHIHLDLGSVLSEQVQVPACDPHHVRLLEARGVLNLSTMTTVSRYKGVNQYN